MEHADEGEEHAEIARSPNDLAWKMFAVMSSN
jgi:hypothetical protein